MNLLLLLIAVPSIVFPSIIFILFNYMKRLNSTAKEFERGNVTATIPKPPPLPFLKETARHITFLARAINDLQRIEVFQQKVLSFEKKELTHLLEKENLARQLEKQLKETQEANKMISSLNVDLEGKNKSLNEAINRLSGLNQVSRMLGSEQDQKQIYKMVVSLPRELLDAQIGYLLLHDSENDELVMEYSQGLGENSHAKRHNPVEKGMAGWVLQNKRSLLVGDFSKQTLFPQKSTMGYERHSAISTPIMIKDKIIGVISLINKKNGESFVEAEKTLLATIASETAMAIHNALLVEKIQKSYFAMVQSLITAVEAKDIYTRGHSERVTQYSRLIAEQMNLPTSRIDIIEKAGVLHDIGKITVELSILNKPSSLSKEEYEKIKLHPGVGYRILKPIDFEDDVKICVLQHHERPDGHGYPNGSKEGEILLEAKILAAADAFDAMTTRRPYREPMSVRSALTELDRCAGTQFDPFVVKVLRKSVSSLISMASLKIISP